MVAVVTILLGRYLWDFRTGAWKIRWVTTVRNPRTVVEPTAALPFLRVEMQ